MEKENILQRVKKLLELSKSANENEAKLAMKNAIRLMDEYKITQKDLDRGFICESNAIISSLKKWEKILLIEASDINTCHVITIYEDKKMIGYKFIGRDINIKATIIMYDYIKDHIQRKDRSIIKTLNDMNSYCTGFVAGMRCKLEELKKCWGDKDLHSLLVVETLDKKEIKDYINSIGGIEKGRLNNIKVDRKIYEKGIKEGIEINLDRQVSDNKNIKQICNDFQPCLF